VTSVFFAPDPPHKGHPWIIGFTATPKQTITDGTMKVDIFLNGKLGFSHSIDICSQEAQKDRFPPCPYSQKINISDTNPGLPIIAPTGLYSGKFTTTDKTGLVLMCFETNWTQV